MRTRKEIEGKMSMFSNIDVITIEILLDIRDLLDKDTKG